MGAPWLVLDRDGVLNQRVPDGYVLDREQLEPVPGALETVAQLSALAGAIVVVTNQAGVGRGLMDRHDLAAIHAELIVRCRDLGGRLDAVLACVHTRDDACRCRKPAPGLFDRARSLIGEPDLTRSVMVGDMRSDGEFAATVGIRFVLIGDQNWSGWPPVDHRGPDLVTVAAVVAQYLSP